MQDTAHVPIKPQGAHAVTRQQVIDTALAMPPGVITDKALQYWVQIGAGIYDAADIVRHATGHEPANPQVCVIALRRLGFFPLQRVRFDGAKVAAVSEATWNRCSYDVTQQRPRA